MALLTASSGTCIFIASFIRTRSWCFLIECMFAVISLLDEVVIESEAVQGGDAECMLAVISLLDEVMIESEVVWGGDAGGDDMALTDTNRLEGALVKVQS
jgi:hypothetical protein